jgi:hypothetical protein
MRMLITRKIDDNILISINKQISDVYGRTNDLPNFRLVWSDDQYEKRWTNYTDEGFILSQPEVRLLPKYRQYIQHKYVLEGLKPVPDQTDLVTKLSYEPIWVFETKKGEALYPRWEAVHFILETLRHNIEHAGETVRYKEDTEEEHAKRIASLQEELFGNETNIGDHLAHKTGISLTGEKHVSSKPSDARN